MKKLMVVLLVIGFFCISHDALAKYNFVNGNNWVAVDAYGISKADKTNIKIMFIKSAIEPAFFNGRPLVENKKDNDYTSYVKIIDQFYSSSENRDMPLFFCVRIADMKLGNSSDLEINNFRLSVMQKLKQIGLE